DVCTRQRNIAPPIDGLCQQGLVDIDMSRFEAHDNRGHIELPCPVDSSTDQLQCLCLMHLQAVYPLPKCQRIVLTKIVYVTHFKPRTFSDEIDLINGFKLAVRENIGHRERTKAKDQMLNEARQDGSSCRFKC